MNYRMTTPCSECPYTMTSAQYSDRQLRAHATGEFPCHKASHLVEMPDGSSEFHAPSDETPHCAGVLIYLEKRNAPHQMMRIAERLGLYDRTKLNMQAVTR